MAVPEGITPEHLTKFAKKRGEKYDGSHSVKQLGHDFVTWFNKKTEMNIVVDDQTALEIGWRISPLLDNPEYKVANRISKISTTYDGHNHNFE